MLVSWYRTRGLRKQAKSLLEMADKVESLRQDILSAADLTQLRQVREDLKAAIRVRPLSPDNLANAGEAVHLHLSKIGGKVYPVTVGTDWTEMIVLAAIVAGGIRSFFLQPFKIPTNSMWPTYHGMTAEVRAPSDPIPSFAERAWGKVTQWSRTIAPLSATSGEVLIPVQNTLVGLEPIPGKQVPDSGILGTGILRGIDRIHSLRIGDRGEVGIQVPDEFTLRGVYLRSFFPTEAALNLSESDRWRRAMTRAEAEGRILVAGGQTYVRTGVSVRAGQPIVNFDILTGDMLFVDKMRYHFVPPAINDPFVFRTGNIAELNRAGEQYYIKRLVGLPGDTLQVVNGKLIRAGQPDFTPGSPIDLNNRKATGQNYFGYLPRCSPADAMPLERARTLSAEGYFAMGDNSSNSYDSRGWGEVPQNDVVGPAFFILYPFTARAGLAK